MATTIHNVGRANNSTKYYCWLKVRVGKREEEVMFFLTSLGRKNIHCKLPDGAGLEIQQNP